MKQNNLILLSLGISILKFIKTLVKSSWRDGSSSDKDRGDGEGDENRSAGRWDHRGNHRSSYDSSQHPPSRHSRPWDPNHHDNHDNLPEW